MKIPPEVFESVASELSAYTIDDADALALGQLLNNPGPHTAVIMESLAQVAISRHAAGEMAVYEGLLNVFLYGVHTGALCRGRIEESAKLEQML